MKFYITKVNKLPSDLGVAYSADVSVNNWVLINDIHYWFEGTQLVLKHPSTVNLTKLYPWRVIGQLGQAFAQVENW